MSAKKMRTKKWSNRLRSVRKGDDKNMKFENGVTWVYEEINLGFMSRIHTCIYKCWNISAPSFNQVMCGRGLPCATHKNAILWPNTYSKSKCDACKIFAPYKRINRFLNQFQELLHIFIKEFHFNYVIIVVILIGFRISVFARNW